MSSKNNIQFVTVSVAMALLAMGCSNDGFRAVRPNKGAFNFVDHGKPNVDGSSEQNGIEGVVTLPPSVVPQEGAGTQIVPPSPVSNSPRMLNLQKAVDEMIAGDGKAFINTEMQFLGEKDANTIMATEVRVGKVSAVKNGDVKVEGVNLEVHSLIHINGILAEVVGKVNTALLTDGKVIRLKKFVIDPSVKVQEVAGEVSDSSADIALQGLVGCVDSCESLFVHVQLNDKSQAKAAAYYNFKKTETGAYEIIPELTSVGKAYKTISTVREEVQSATRLQREAAEASAKIEAESKKATEEGVNNSSADQTDVKTEGLVEA